MPESANTPEDKNEGGNIARLLMRLPRRKASPNFEAQLSERIRAEGGRRRGAWGIFGRPLPAYAFTAIMLMAVGTIGYFWIFVPDQSEGPHIKESPANPSTPNPSSATSPADLPARVPQTPEQQFEDPSRQERGPSSPGNDPILSGRIGRSLESEDSLISDSVRRAMAEADSLAKQEHADSLRSHRSPNQRKLPLR